MYEAGLYREEEKYYRNKDGGGGLTRIQVMINK